MRLASNLSRPSRLWLYRVLGLALVTGGALDAMPGKEIWKPKAHRPGPEFLAAWDAEVEFWKAKVVLQRRFQSLQAIEDEMFEALEPGWRELPALEETAGRAQALAAEKWAQWHQYCAAQEQAMGAAQAAVIWRRLASAAMPEPVEQPSQEIAASADPE